MLGKGINGRSAKWILRASGVLLGLAIAAGPVMGSDRIDPEADKILRSMSTYLGGLSAFSADADVDIEIIDLEGQKLQLSSSTTVIAERPDKLHIGRHGAVADLELISDGKTLTIHGKNQNAYFQMENPGSIDAVMDAVRSRIGMEAPAADFMYSDAYPSLASGVTRSAYLGTAFVNGEESHYLTFRENQVDWQLWVKAGDEPLPMKYIITTKWMTGAPQYSVRFRDWNTKPQIEAGQFSFTLPEGATKVDAVALDEMGEPVMGGVE